MKHGLQRPLSSGRFIRGSKQHHKTLQRKPFRNRHKRGRTERQVLDRDNVVFLIVTTSSDLGVLANVITRSVEVIPDGEFQTLIAIIRRRLRFFAARSLRSFAQMGRRKRSRLTRQRVARVAGRSPTVLPGLPLTISRAIPAPSRRVHFRQRLGSRGRALA